MNTSGEICTNSGETVVGLDGMIPDDRTMDGVIDRNYACVYRYAYRLTGCAAAAEDVVQETFLKAVRHYDQLRVAEAERSWLLSIARREFGRWLAKHTRAKSGLTDEQAAHDPGPDESARVDAKDWLQAALDRLEGGFRQVILMYYIEELSYAEISKHLGVPIGTVMSRLSRARSYLKKWMDVCEHLSNSNSPAALSSECRHES
ncbi:MAG: sigma-70 family RNA polymerase sigma factor [Pirellulales bacterium]